MKMRETREELEQWHREKMRLGAWAWWDKGDVGNTKNKRNAVIAMARYKGHTYTAIAKGAGITPARARCIAEEAARHGRLPLYHAEAAGSYLAKGNYDCTKTYLSTEDLKKLITYCEALK